MFSESPCGLADSEIRTTIAPDSEIRRSKEARPPARRDSFDIRMANKRVVTTPKSGCHEMTVKTDNLFRFG